MRASTDLDRRVPVPVPEEVLGLVDVQVRLCAREVEEVVGRRADRRASRTAGRAASAPAIGAAATSAASIAGLTWVTEVGVPLVPAGREVAHRGDLRLGWDRRRPRRPSSSRSCRAAGRGRCYRLRYRRGEPQRREQHHEAGEAGRGDEEAEARAEVGAEQEVGRSAEQPDRAHHDEHAEDRRVPEVRVGRTFGEKQRKSSHRHPFPPRATVVVVVAGDPRPCVGVRQVGSTPVNVVASRQYRS